jgi:DNA-binding NarL/FixJ family response regulator
MIRILLVDDQQLLMDLMEHMLRDTDIQVVACAKDGLEAVKLADEFNPDIVLMDIQMPLCNGIEATKIIKEKHINTKVLILTASSNSEDVHNALDFGADGYTLKSISQNELLLAIKSVHANLEVIHSSVRGKMNRASSNNVYKNANKTIVINGVEVELSKRELKIIEMLVNGKSTLEMAAALFISVGRLRNILSTIIEKMMLKDRAQVVAFAIKNKLI